MNITPSGKVLPCHAAASIPGLAFDNVRDKRLSNIWLASEAFQAFRGTAWMREPCRSCDLREIDWGGCRCQAFAIAGVAAETDPACDKSFSHPAFARAAETESVVPATAFVHRRPGGAQHSQVSSAILAQDQRVRRHRA
jgi:PqqA peptide cyclase